MARAHGRTCRTGPRVWTCNAPMPPFYPNAVTLEPGLTFAALASELPVGLSGDWGLKDSFRDLALDGEGFARLFDAAWIARAPGPADWPGADLTVALVATPADLARWAAAWGESGAAIFVPALLTQPGVGFLAARRGEAIAGGLALMRSAGVTGFSNAFGEPDAIAACLGRLRDEPVVGYETPDAAAALAPFGFATIGPLRIWARRPA